MSPRSLRTARSLALAALAAVSATAQAPLPRPTALGDAPSPALERVFVTNAGQWPEALRARFRAGAGSAWFHDAGLTLHLEQRAAVQPEDAGSLGGPAIRSAGFATIHLRFAGAARTVSPVAAGRDFAPVRWVRGDGAAGIDTHVAATHESLRYPQVWDGIDAVFRGVDGRLAYEFEVAAGVPAAGIEFACDGVTNPLTIDAEGQLVLATALGVVRHEAPRGFEIGPDGSMVEVPVRFALRGTDRYGFTTERRDASRPLWIDPGIDWSSFIGGTGGDAVFHTEAAGDGLFVLTGPTVTGLPAPWNSGAAAGPFSNFVTLVDTNQAGAAAVVWSTIVGGSAAELALDLAHDPVTGITTIVGETESADFPVTPNAFQATHAGGHDGFVTRLDGGGNVVYSTFYGTAGDDRLVDVVDTAGLVTVAGASNGNLPMAGTPWQATRAGGTDGVVAQFDVSQAPGAQLIRSTWFGGVNNEGQPFDRNSYYRNFDQKVVRVLPNGDVTVITNTQSSMPTTAGAFQSTIDTGYDVWIARFDAQLSTLQAATLFGGNAFDFPSCADVDDAGIVTLGIVCQSTNLPTTAGALDTSYSGSNDSFLARIDLSRTGAAQLVYGSYFGDFQIDELNDVVLEPSSGIATFVGQTRAAGFGIPPTPGAFQRAVRNGTNGLILRLDTAGNGLRDAHYASYLTHGTSPVLNQYSHALGIARDRFGRFLIVGETAEASFPVGAGGPQPSLGGGVSDGFLVRMDLLPENVDPIGVPSTICTGFARMQVNSQPRTVNQNFAILCENGPPNVPGVVLFGLPNPAGQAFFGVQLFATPIVTVGVQSDARGFGSLALPAPAGITYPAGLAAQFVWADCNGARISTSNALAF